MKINISVSAEMPEKVDENYKHKSLCEKARDYMMCCESDMDSDYHWRYLKALYEKLQALPKLPEQYMELMMELDEFMGKHGKYASGDNTPNLTGENMFKYRKEV